MSSRSEGATVSSAPSTSGEVTRLMLGYLFPSRDTRGESRLSLWTQKHGDDDDELADGPMDSWAGLTARNSVSDDTNHQSEALQDACARYKAVQDKGYASPRCPEEKAGATVEGSDLRVLVEGMLAVCCPTYRGLCAEEAQVPSTKAFNARKTLYNAKRLLHLYKTVHGLSGVWPEGTLLALHSDVDFQIRTRLRSRLSRQDFPGILAVEDNELKLQLAEVLVALAKAVYDLGAVGAALTPHNHENLQICHDLLEVAGMREPEVPAPRPVIFKRSPKKEAAAAAKAKNAAVVGSPNGSKGSGGSSGGGGKNRELHETKNLSRRRREVMPHHHEHHAPSDRPPVRYAQPPRGYPTHGHPDGHYGSGNGSEWAPSFGPMYHQGPPQTFAPRATFYENNYASLGPMPPYARDPYAKFETSMR